MDKEIHRARDLALLALGGLVTGIAFTYLGAAVGSRLLVDVLWELRRIVAVTAGVLVGYPLGVSLGMAWVAGVLGRPRRLSATLLGACLGTWGLVALLAPGGGGDWGQLWIFPALSGLLGALMASSRPRRHRVARFGAKRSTAAGD